MNVEQYKAAVIRKLAEMVKRKNYAAEKKKEDLKNKEFGVYKPGGIYYTSYGY